MMVNRRSFKSYVQKCGCSQKKKWEAKFQKLAHNLAYYGEKVWVHIFGARTAKMWPGKQRAKFGAISDKFKL